MTLLDVSYDPRHEYVEGKLSNIRANVAAYHWEGNDEKSVKFSLASPEVNISTFFLEFRKFHKSYNINLRGIRKKSARICYDPMFLPKIQIADLAMVTG